MSIYEKTVVLFHPNIENYSHKNREYRIFKPCNTSAKFQAKLAEIALKRMGCKLGFSIEKATFISSKKRDGFIQYKRLVHFYFSFSQGRYISETHANYVGNRIILRCY